MPISIAGLLEQSIQPQPGEAPDGVWLEDGFGRLERKLESLLAKLERQGYNARTRRQWSSDPDHVGALAEHHAVVRDPIHVLFGEHGGGVTPGRGVFGDHLICRKNRPIMKRGTVSLHQALRRCKGVIERG